MSHGKSRLPDRRRNVGVRNGRADDRFGCLHDLCGCSVVDRQRLDTHVATSDTAESLRPRLGEPRARLRPVADDRDAPGRVAPQHHSPLRRGEFLRLVDDDVREGSVESVGFDVRRGRLVHKNVAQVVLPKHRHQALAVVVGRRRHEVVDDEVHSTALSAEGGRPAAAPIVCAAVSQSVARGVEKREVGVGPRVRTFSLEESHLIRRQPRGTHSEERGNRPQVADEIRRVEHRPRAPYCRRKRFIALQRFLHIVPVEVVVTDASLHRLGQVLPDRTPRLVVWRARLGRRECFGPIPPPHSHIRPLGLDQKRLRRRFLVPPHRRLDRVDHPGRRLQCRHGVIGLGHRGIALGDQIAQRARLHAFFTEARQDIGDIRQVLLVRPDDQEAATREPRVGVEQIGGTMQRHHGLSCTGAAIDDQRACRVGADDGVLVGLDRRQHVAHAWRPTRRKACEQRRITIEPYPVVDGVRGEHFVPVVGDLPARPSIASARAHSHRLRRRRVEERSSGGGSPVDEQLSARRVGQSDTADIHGLQLVGQRHPSDAQVEPEATKRP